MARAEELEKVMEEGLTCEKCWNAASGKQCDRAVPEFDVKIGTKDTEEAYGVGMMPQEQS